MDEKLLKPSEVAQILRVSTSFTYKLIRSGEIVSVRLGRSVRVAPKDLEACIAKNRSGNDAYFKNTELDFENCN